MSETTTTVALNVGKPSRGKYPVALMAGQTVLLADRIDPHASNRIQKFVREAKKQYVALDADALRTELLQLAAPKDNVVTGDDNTNGDDCPYAETDNGLVWLKMTKEGTVPVPLTNFNARIVTDIIRDDGAERQHVFEIEAELAGLTRKFKIPAAQFNTMNWVIEHLGAGAIVHPGNAIKDRARAAIQTLSSDHTIQVIHAHTGWLKHGDDWLYLHNGGAIGSAGAVKGLEVDISDALSGYELPSPPKGEELVQAVRASLRLLDLGPDFITFPMFSAIYRAVLGECDFSLHFAGTTGVFKTEFTALGQQHYGPAMDARHLPANWTSTDNALEGQAFTAKDALMTIDDYAPGGTQIDVQKLRQKADRVIRGAGNHAGRGRMRPDGTIRPNKPPRCLIVSTGEDVPAGHSLRARMLIEEIGPGDISRERLTACQADARSGLYAASMAGFLRWLAARMNQVRAELHAKIARHRARASASSFHARTPEIVANLAVGMHYFLSFAIVAGAITKAEATEMWTRCWHALGQAAAKQATFQRAMEPARRFLELLASALTAGNAHLARADGRQPPTPTAWGWRQIASSQWQPQGPRIGWVDGEHIYLDPDASFKAAQGMAIGGDGIALTPQTLRKRLHEKNLLIRAAGRDELTIRRNLEGVQRHVLCLRRSSLLIAAPPAHPPDSPFSPAGDAAPSATPDGNGGSSAGNGSEIDSADLPAFTNPVISTAAGSHAGGGNGTTT